MFKVDRRKLKLTIITAFLLFSPYINEAASISSYSKTWTQPNTSKLEITISSYTTNLLVNTVYTYKINFEVIAVSSNLDSFYSIAVSLRFVCEEETIKSDLKCNIGNLPTVGSKLHVLIQLPVPSATEMSLNRGESLEGQLQYIVYYSEKQKDWDKSEMAPNQWPHESDQILGWETISQGSLTNPFIDLTSLATIAIITASLICSGILIFIFAKKRAKK